MPNARANLPFLFASILAAGLLAALFVLDPRIDARSVRFVFAPPEPAGTEAAPKQWSRTVAAFDAGFPHSPTLIEHEDRSLQAVWFYGSAEAQADVALWSARLTGEAWSKPERLFGVPEDATELGYRISTIGNPALFAGPAGETWLVYADPSLGGWSTSRLALRRSADGGMTWSPARQLVTSPLFSMSSLPRYGALPMEGGNFGLPAYHELATDFSELLVLGPDGRVADKRRVGPGGNTGIQPALIEPRRGVIDALIRPMPGMEKRLHRSRSADGGISWSEPVATSLHNPSSPACAVRLASGDTLFAYNDSETERTALSFVHIDGKTGATVRLAKVISAEGESGSASYCTLIQRRNGDVAMVYSNPPARRIEEFGFNLTWLARAAKGGMPLEPWP